jgi:NodT family efflux transporter outer membrane factor (OMF) lipoprotein
MSILQIRSIAAVAATSLLAACAVGPNYLGPPNAAPRSTAAGEFHRAAEADAMAAPAPSRWWEALGDPQLTGLIDQALANSPSTRAARARLLSARAALGESQAKLLPTGGGSALTIKGSVPTGAFGQLVGGAASAPGREQLNLYSAGFDATWELDIFGGQRRAIEAARAQAGAQQAQLDDTQVELAAEVAQVYVSLRDDQARLALARQAVAIDQQTLALTNQRREGGTAADGDVERAQAELERAWADVPPLAADAQVRLDQLSLLTGQEPGAVDAALSSAAAVPTPPAATPVGDPAGLLRRRPDVREAERKLAASNAQIGRQVAQYFPTVTLLGDIGFSGTDARQLLRASNFSALGGPSISWNLFNYPRIAAQVGGAKADRDAALEDYQQAVLAALQDANAALTRYGHQRQTVAALTRAQASADRAAALVRTRYAAGAASLIDLLDAQRQQLSARQSLAQGAAALTGDYISLQKSLGLGWS